MSKDKISDYSATANSNTDIAGINIDEGCAPSGINNAIRTLMKQLKDFQQGTNSDSFNGPTNGAHNGSVGATTPAAGTFTTLSATGNVTLGDASADTVTVNGTTNFVAAPTIGGVGLGMGFKNRIINGAMMIDQRNAGASVTPSADTYLLDRWGYSASQTSKFTFQQNKGSVSLPDGFSNYLGASVASAVSIGASDYFALYTKIEGLNVADLGWGAAGASTVTLSFKVYSSLTGTFGGTLCNSANTRCYPFTYSVPVANTWTTVSITIVGDTSGTWLKTNGTGINVQFGLGVGSTYSGTAGSWSGTQYISATGAVSVVGTNGATFYITGVQLEKGSTATSFDYRPYGTELQLCQRYLPAFNSVANTSYQTVASGFNSTTGLSYFSIPFQVPARTQPTGVTTANYNSFQIAYRTSAQTATSLSFVDGSTVAARVSVGGSGLTAGDGVILLYQNGSSSVGQLLFTGCEL